MTMLPLDAFSAALICPKCRERLHPIDFRCSSGHSFKLIGGQPVLVDFDHSILAEDEVVSSNAGSAITRGGGGLKGSLVGLMLPKNEVAAKNARRLIDEMPKGGTLLVIGGADAGTGTEALYEEIGVIGFDIYGTRLTQFVADAHQIPLADASVDAVWIQAVLEHVLDPWGS